MRSKSERHRWILAQRGVYFNLDTLNAQFVDAYIKAMNAPFFPQPYGAHRCPVLGRDLGDLYKRGMLERNRIGLPGAEAGFPRWIYSYTFTAPARPAPAGSNEQE